MAYIYNYNIYKVLIHICFPHSYNLHFFCQIFVENPKFLRNLQELRSSGTGHRKGKGYKKISKVFDVQKGNYREAFTNILEQATSFLEYIEQNIDMMKAEKDS